MIQHLDWNVTKTDLIPQAVLNKTPQYFEKTLGVKFLDDHDGLDYFKVAPFCLVGGVFFALKQYRGHNPKTTTIYLKPELQDVAKITEIVGCIVDELSLESGDIVWQRKDEA